jgi:hypothetical protein
MESEAARPTPARRRWLVQAALKGGCFFLVRACARCAGSLKGRVVNGGSGY